MSTPATPAAPAASQAQPTASAQAPAQTQPTTQEIKKLKLKLDGKEVELPESEVIAGYQTGQVAAQRFKEAAKMRQEAEQILQFAKQNPKEFFQKTGMNAREWAEQYLLEELQAEAMSPEQRKARENEDKIRKYEQDDKDRKETQRQEQMKRLEQEHMQNYDVMFTKALSESGLPKTVFTVRRMAELQLINVKNKYELNASQLAKLVREDYIAEQKALLGGFEGDQLIDFLGPDLVKKLSKAQIAKLKAKGLQSNKPNPTSRKTEETQGLTWDEYRRRNRGRA